MKNIIMTLALLALIGQASAQQAPPAPQAPEAEPIRLPKGETMNGESLEVLLELYSELTDKTVITAQNLPKVRADATQLSQAFLNLILNAAEAMPDGGTLTISSVVDDGKVAVAFSDTGPGMTEEQRERAFTGMLSTTKEKGGGLGLAIVAKVAEAHGGRVELESEEGWGTVITFCLAAE